MPENATAVGGDDITAALNAIQGGGADAAASSPSPAMPSGDLLKMPAFPSMPKLRDVPKAPQDQFENPMRQFGGPAMFLAALGSLMTRHPMKTALNSASEMIQADVKGQKEQMELHRENWRNSTEAALAQNRIEVERYKAIMNKYQHDTEAQAAYMMGMASGFNDPQMQAMMSTGQIQNVWSLIQDREKRGKEASDFLLRQREQDERQRHNMATEGRTAEQMAQRDRQLDISERRMGVMEKSLGLRDPEVKSAAASLTKLEQQKNSIESFEKTAIKNGEMLSQLADKVDKTGIPVFERWSRAGRKSIAGDTDVSDFQLQYELFTAEAAKILTNPNLTGVLTNRAREEMHEAISPNASAAQIKSAINLLKRDFSNRKEAADDQINEVRRELRQRMGKPAEGGASGGSSGGFTGRTATNPKTGEKLRETSDGQWVQ